MQDTKTKLVITDYQPGERYDTVARTFEGLGVGETMEITNDHDIRPLLEVKLLQDFPNQYYWEYIEEGPKVFRAVITKKQ